MGSLFWFGYNTSGDTKETIASTTDPDCGLFHKGEHKVAFAYTTHVCCDKNNFVLSCETVAGNIHDSRMFDVVYENTIATVSRSGNCGGGQRLQNTVDMQKSTGRWQKYIHSLQTTHDERGIPQELGVCIR